MASEQCPECGSSHLVEEEKEQEFQYGDGIHTPQVALKASFPVTSCKDCGFATYDYRGEIARDAAVQRYLDQQLSESGQAGKALVSGTRNP
jgi:hypothetical protein